VTNFEEWPQGGVRREVTYTLAEHGTSLVVGSVRTPPRSICLPTSTFKPSSHTPRKDP
jgi:hypothetical protein